jgi:hypothetical protein
MNTCFPTDLTALGFIWIVLKGLKDLNWTNLIAGFILNGLIVGFLVARYKSQLTKQLEEYKNSLAKELELYRFENNRREQSAIVAECLAAWCSILELNNPQETERLHKLTWEATLKLPDDIAVRLNEILAHKSQESIKNILVDVKKFLWGEKTSLTADKIVHFNSKGSTPDKNT